MFKTASFEQELMQSMSEKLVENQTENQYSYNKIAKAADYLNAAAEIFDDTGMHKEAEVITRLLEKMAQEAPAQDFAAPPSTWDASKGPAKIDPQAKWVQDLQRTQQKQKERESAYTVETSRPAQAKKVEDLSSLPPKLLPTFLANYFPANSPVMTAVKSKLSKTPVYNLEVVKGSIQQSKLTPMQKDQLITYLSSPTDTEYVSPINTIINDRTTVYLPGESGNQSNYVPVKKK